MLPSQFLSSAKSHFQNAAPNKEYTFANSSFFPLRFPWQIPKLLGPSHSLVEKEHMDYLPHEGCPTLVPNPAFRYSLRPTTVTGKYPNTKCVSCSTLNHLVPPEREVIPPCVSSQTQNSVQTITVTQYKPSTPTRQNGKKQLDKESSVSVMSLHHSRAELVPTTLGHFATPTVFGLPGLNRTRP